MSSRTPSRRILEPSERAAEILFALIMTLTFTGTLSVVDAGRDDVRAMLIGALGCNLAWGIIDGIIHLMDRHSELSGNLLALREARNADAATARARIADALPPVVASVLQDAELETIRQRLSTLPEPPRHARLARRDWLGALGVCLLVFTTTFPLAVPFLFMQHLVPAMRVSNAVALVLLFLTGVVYARSVNRPAWRVGTWMVILGCVLVALTIALGG
ncbi:VIT1/CCC1 transporter family protein [Lysobacter panacisoli]|nr:VIT1/CCC1 transporter family protein [Lysobacter panacisoli]